jgi:tetratricopeptide (TPR) repeat protein
MSGQPNGNAVHLHLNDILASPGFARSKKLGAFLPFVVTRAIDGDAGSVTERNIALQVYGRRDDFDPKVDGIVRAEAIRLRHKLREFYESAGESGPRIEIPKGGYVPVFTGFEDTVEAAPLEVAKENPRAWVRAVAPYAVLGMAAVLLATAGWRYVVGSAKPVKASTLVAQANARKLIGDEFGALALLDQALAIDPNSVDVHLARAVVFEYLGQLKNARLEIDRAQELSALQGSYSPEVALEVHALDGDAPGVVQRLLEMLKSRPKDLGLLIELARRNGAGTSAAEFIRLARQLPGASSNPELDRLEALWLGFQGKNKEAIEVVLRGERKAAAVNASYSLGRLMLLEGGLRMQDLQNDAAAVPLMRARNWCLSSGDEICVAVSYRVDGNHVLLDHHQYAKALREYQQAMAIARPAEHWAELKNLQEGIDEAVEGIDPQLTATDFFRKQFEVLSEALR